MFKMALSEALYTLALLAAVAGLSESSHGSIDSPIITSTNLLETVVNPGENYTVTCESPMPVIWNYPNISDNEPRIHETQKNGKYVSSIQLTNITYKDVGYYNCSLLNNNEKNSSIYLYVNDTENLLARDDESFVPIRVIQYQDIIIPCKPTHPEVKVTLCYNGVEKLHIGDNDEFGIIRYNQKVGFILKNAHLRHNGYYSCCTNPGGFCSDDEYDHFYSVEVLRHVDSVARPAIEDTHLQHVKVGENVTIECSLSVPAFIQIELEWIVPNVSNRITVEEMKIMFSMTHRHKLATRKLKIVDLKLEDTGNYTCKVRDHAGNTNSETIYLKIFGRYEAYINLTANENKTIAEVDEGQDFQWVINVEAHPQPQFLWFKNDAEINNSSRMIITSRSNGKQSILEIKHVSIQDEGTYVMEAVNTNFTKDMILKLNVLGKPHVFMPQYPLKFLYGSSHYVNVTILGRPSPNVTWFFQPDGNAKMSISSKNFKNYIVSEEEGYKTVSELQLNATVSGTVECKAANKFGNDSEKTQIIIIDVADGFGILPVEEEIVKGDTVTLTCRASKHNFTKNMKWYRNGEEVDEYNSTKRIFIQKEETNYSFQTKLVIANVSESDGTEYKCVACTPNPNICTDKVSTFTVAATRSPQSSNDTIMDSGEHFVDNLSQYSLNCRLSGIPKPEIVWMKDGKPLPFKVNDTSMEFTQNNTTLVIKQFTAQHAGLYTCTAINPRNKNDRKSVSATLIFKVQPASLAKPVIEKFQLKHVKVGENVTTD